MVHRGFATDTKSAGRAFLWCLLPGQLLTGSLMAQNAPDFGLETDEPTVTGTVAPSSANPFVLRLENGCYQVFESTNNHWREG
jgi:hypothetical protein